MPQPDTLDPRILGQRIAEARKARGKTQEEVAEFRLRLSTPSLSLDDQRPSKNSKNSASTREGKIL